MKRYNQFKSRKKSQIHSQAEDDGNEIRREEKCVNR